MVKLNISGRLEAVFKYNREKVGVERPYLFF